MKNLYRWIPLLAGLMIFIACGDGDDDPTAPTTVTPPPSGGNFVVRTIGPRKVAFQPGLASGNAQEVSVVGDMNGWTFGVHKAIYQAAAQALIWDVPTGALSRSEVKRFNCAVSAANWCQFEHLISTLSDADRAKFKKNPDGSWRMCAYEGANGEVILGCTISGNPPPAGTLSRVIVSGASDMTVGGQNQLTASCVYGGGSQVCSPPAVWVTRSTEVATVNQNGLVTGVSPGQVWIVAAVGTKADSLRVNVSGTVSQGCTTLVAGLACISGQDTLAVAPNATPTQSGTLDVFEVSTGANVLVGTLIGQPRQGGFVGRITNTAQFPAGAERCMSLWDRNRGIFVSLNSYAAGNERHFGGNAQAAGYCLKARRLANGQFQLGDGGSTPAQSIVIAPRGASIPIGTSTTFTVTATGAFNCGTRFTNIASSSGANGVTVTGVSPGTTGLVCSLTANSAVRDTVVIIVNATPPVTPDTVWIVRTADDGRILALNGARLRQGSGPFLWQQPAATPPATICLFGPSIPDCQIRADHVGNWVYHMPTARLNGAIAQGRVYTQAYADVGGSRFWLWMAGRTDQPGVCSNRGGWDWVLGFWWSMAPGFAKIDSLGCG